jgi:TolB protein
MTNYSVGDGTSEIWIMNADGTDQRQLTDNEVDDRGSAWSPDSRHLLYSVTAVDRRNSDLWLMDVTTGTARQLTALPGHEYAPIWSPDEEWVIFTHILEGEPDKLYAMRADGTALQPLLGNEQIHSISADAWLPPG